MKHTMDVDYGGITWTVEFGYSPYCPGCHTLRSGDPGYPEEPAEVEILSIRLADSVKEEAEMPDLCEFLDTHVLEGITTAVEENYAPEEEY